jgi:exopolysaccharide biosynthesis polyprenyl glycosylphosphotransferase
MSAAKSPAHSPGPVAARLPAPAAADPTCFLPKAGPNRLLGVLIRRGWLVVPASLLGGAGFYWFAGTLPKTYRAAGSVYVSSQAPLVLDIRAVAPEETRDLEQMRSLEQGMSASTLLMNVIKVNGLDQDPSFAPAGTGEQVLLGIMSKRVEIALRRGTRIIDIQVTDTDPERAKRLVGSLVTEYEKWTSARQELITRQAGEGLAREELRLREHMDASARKLQDFRKEHPVPGLEGSESGSPVRDSLATLSAQLTEGKAARLRLESEFEAFSRFDPSKPEALAGLESSERGTEVLSQVRALQSKEADFGRVKKRYLFKHPVYQESAGEIRILKTNLAETVRAAGQSLEQRYRVAKENELKLASEVTRARGNAVDVEGLRERFRRMSRDAEADRTLHDSVALRLRETSLAASVPASVLRWEDTPLTPERPDSPKKTVFAAVGLFFGFLGGLVLLIGLEVGDQKIRDSAAVARAIGSPLLTSLPALENSADGMVLISAPASAGAEAFRRLRVVLAPPPGSTTARTVLFTSAKAGEGKSFCALNYATALAMQGHRTLLLDADLHSPGLSRQHLDGDNGDSGLGGYLAGKIDPAETCFTTALPNLYLLTSGPMRADAAELLAGTRFPALLEEAYRWFDRVVIDTPPVLAVSDMLAIARYAERTCLVVSDGSSGSRELKRAAELVRSAGGSLVGFVWNEALNSHGFTAPGPGVPVNRAAISEAPAAVAHSADTESDTYVIRFETGIREVGVVDPLVNVWGYCGHVLLGSVYLIFLLANFRLHDPRNYLAMRKTAATIIKACVIWGGSFLALTLVLKIEPAISRIYCVIGSVAAMTALLAWRWVLYCVLRREPFAGALRQKAVFVGWNRECDRAFRRFGNGRANQITVSGAIAPPRMAFEIHPPDEVPVLGSYSGLRSIIRSSGADLVMVVEGSLDRHQMLELAETCGREFIDFKLVPSCFQILVSGLRLESFHGMPVLGIGKMPLHHAFNNAAKRSVDITGSLVGMFLSAPVMALFATLVYLESPGRVIYRQRRIGLNGRRFFIYKIRSMKLDAEAASTPGWTVKDDPRRLRIGALMREWNIDELPQFWNVLRGEMSLVGPRPERPELIEDFKEEIPHYNVRHNIKPGVTGWAQVHGLRGDTCLHERVKFDLDYIENWKFTLDLQIMLMTLYKRGGAC